MDNDSKDGFKTIKPAAFNRTSENTTAPTKTRSISPKSLNVTLGLVFMLVSLIIVIFFLPGWVENNKSTESSTSPATATTSKSSEIKLPEARASSPEEKHVIGQLSLEEQTQNLALRKEAQIFLQEILEKQKLLEENNAQSWAGKEYTTGLNHAKKGDELYNQQQFSVANQEYKRALQLFNRLTEQVGPIYQENLEHGMNALDTGDSNLALTAFSKAALFTDDSQEAAKGIVRAQKLDDVFAHIEDGDGDLSEGRLTEAKMAYQAALELDPDTRLAQQKLLEVNKLLAEKQFNSHMSAGYDGLEQQSFAKALDQFNKALKIKPGSSAAKTALQQTKHQMTTIDIAKTLKEASAREKNEQWQMAIELYEKALKLEKNLAEAQAGKLRAQNQLSIHQRLEQILSRPERLSDKKVHAETSAYYSVTSQFDNQGPILTKQLADLENLLKVSATPVKIRLQSDNLTDVVVYKVGKMGMFQTRELNLRPGKYIAIGRRDGYRDVRIEFLVSQDTNKQAIQIVAKERIN